MRLRSSVLPLLIAAVATIACANPAQEHIDRSQELIATGDPNGAISELEEATRLDPSNPTPWNNLANLNLQLGRNERAMELYRRAIEADPERLEPHYNLANALMDAERAEEALEQYERAAAIDDSNAQVHFNLAYALYELDRFDKAWVALEHARSRGADDESITQLEAAIRHFYTPEPTVEPPPADDGEGAGSGDGAR